MLTRSIPSFLIALLFVGSQLAPVDAASPTLSIIQPRGGQRGTELEVVFSGARLADAQEIYFYEPGMETLKIEAIDANQIKVQLKINADCRLGEHVLQVRTATGISDYRTFYVGALPSVAEVEPNTDFETPQIISMNSTLVGVVTSEDVDYFQVEAKKGDRISVEVEAMRLGSTLFDPYVAILDSRRFELASSDDSPLVWQDAVCSVIAPEDGQYTIEMRESAYAGSGGCQYRLHIGNFPRPTAAYPAGGKMGEELEVRFLGMPSGELVQKFPLPTTFNEDFGLFASDAGGIAPSANPTRLTEHGNVLEVEPNETIEQATPAELPMAFNGIIQVPGDVDLFKFSAKQGVTYEIECYARRVRSPLDAVMVLLNAQGQAIASNDDSRGPDSYFRFAVPADGDYFIQVYDHLKRGGVDFVYRVEFQPIPVNLSLGIPRVARYSQYRQTIFVPRGGRFATVMTCSRNNWGGDMVLETPELPLGMTMTAEPMPANLTSMPVLFEAAADAPLSGKLVDLRGRHADPAQNITGGFTNFADLIIGDGQRLYWGKKVDQLAVAVVDELPFSIEIVQPQVPIVRNGSMQLKIVATRKEGFTAPITVQVPFLPPGVSGASSVQIPEGQNEITYPLNANGGAEIKSWKIFALGNANVDGDGWVSSQLATLDVADMFVQFAMERAAVELGQTTDLFCKITVTTPFEGNAKAQVLGLPHMVTAPEMEFTKDTQELVFKVSTNAEMSPPGTHKNIFCQVVITQNGEPIVHSVGGTEVRIDKPLPAPTTPEPMPMPVAQAEETPKPPEEKRLTRLEKLRLEAKARAEAAAAGGGE
ncbi:MAG: PPC domain-containing protein [Planctomycetota bacterium]|nr:PPC domain-containing protein [Planctomycetota bacterium]MDA1213735.1 PPC domain-containing protein [Planctomycetota bacterium]